MGLERALSILFPPVRILLRVVLQATLCCLVWSIYAAFHVRPPGKRGGEAGAGGDGGGTGGLDRLNVCCWAVLRDYKAEGCDINTHSSLSFRYFDVELMLEAQNLCLFIFACLVSCLLVLFCSRSFKEAGKVRHIFPCLFVYLFLLFFLWPFQESYDI